MLCHRKDDTEKRNEHLKHMVFALVIVAFLAAAPNIIFLIVGVDITTGCALDDEANCLSQDDSSITGELFTNANLGLLVYRFVIAFGGILAIGYKGIAA